MFYSGFYRGLELAFRDVDVRTKAFVFEPITRRKKKKPDLSKLKAF